MTAIAGIAARLGAAIDTQRGGLFCWVPVCLALGIGGYFALPVGPAPLVWAVLGAFGCAGAFAVLWIGPARWPLATGLVLVLFGLLVAGAHSAIVADPVLSFRYYGPVQGRIVGIDRSASDKVRLTLDRVVLDRVPPWRTPGRVRVSLHSPLAGTTPEPGKTVLATAHLSGPSGPVEPGGFDFQRMAWFQGLGAVGYTRVPVLALAPAPTRPSVADWRLRISAAVRRALPGEPGAFAAAITTGDRSAMGQQTVGDLRAANLAHLLAISGLHMGLLTTFVFAALRLMLVAVPGLALTWPVKKIAAAGALAAGAVYLALSGGNVATQRAFVMVAVMLIAVMLDRRALTLRAVAVAAVIVLLLRPESLTGPGFQMSFAATIALVAVFRLLRDGEVSRVPRVLRPVLAVVVSSAVAGAATAPIAAAHFNTIAHYGLLANLLSVPLMGTVVMPGAVLAACLSPFGLQGVGLAMMEPGIRWILAVAHWTAGQPGAVGRIVSPAPVVLPLFALGMLWLVLWVGRARLAGVVPVLLAGLLWSQTDRPALLISDSGGLIGVLTPAGRALNKPRGEGFVAQGWLENDGDGAEQALASERAGIDDDGRFRLGTLKAVHLSGRGAAEQVGPACAHADMVILAADLEGAPPDGCLIFDRAALRAAGGFAVFEKAGKLEFRSARALAGRRAWNSE